MRLGLPSTHVPRWPCQGDGRDHRAGRVHAPLGQARLDRRRRRARHPRHAPLHPRRPRKPPGATARRRYEALPLRGDGRDHRRGGAAARAGGGRGARRRAQLRLGEEPGRRLPRRRQGAGGGPRPLLGALRLPGRAAGLLRREPRLGLDALHRPPHLLARRALLPGRAPRVSSTPPSSCRSSPRPRPTQARP